MSATITRFIEFLRYEKKFSNNTLISYKNDLDQFSTFILGEFELDKISEVSHNHIRSWISSLIQDKILTRSINRKLSTLKSYFKFLRKEGVLITSPLLKIQSPKTSKTLPVFVDESKMEKLTHFITDNSPYANMLIFLIVELLYQTGMRRSELINLKERDFDIFNCTVKVLGKRNKERIIPISNELKKMIENYLKLKSENNFVSENLILSEKGKKINEKFVYNTVKTKLAEISTLKKKSPHILRHTFATHMLNNGADINAVKELLGHSSLAATQVYTHNTADKLKKAHKAAHPRAK